MYKTPQKEDYSRTLILCEDIKNKLEELQFLLNTTVNQGLSKKIEECSKDLENWIEEIEFNITLPEYEQN
jgi:hypothetical protein